MLLAVSCTHNRSEKPEIKGAEFTPPEKTLVLIQGYHLDEHSWSEMIKHVPEEKYNVMALGRVARDGEKPASLKNIAIKSCQEINAHSILVAHSFGGAIANQMFGYCPSKIIKIIYVSALIPNVDELPFARMKNDAEQAIYAQAVNMDNQLITPKEPKTFYKVMDPEVNTSSNNLPRLYAESVSLTTEEVFFNAERFKQLPKSYVITTKDAVVSQGTQKMFLEDASITRIEKISTGHFPMIAQPKKLADIILKLADLN